MRYVFIGSIILVVTLLISKLFMAIYFVNSNKYYIVAEPQKDNPSKQLAKTGKLTYLVYCSSCHGKDGKGNNNKAQNHTKRMAKKSILDVINNGSNNFKSIYPSGMPGGLIGENDAKVVAEYVAGGLKGNKPKTWVVCANCHQENGEGIPFIAPNIAKYSDELISTVLNNGKKGVIGTMPNFKGRFSEAQIKALAAHIRSLGK